MRIYWPVGWLRLKPVTLALALTLPLLSGCGSLAVDGKAVSELSSQLAKPPAEFSKPCDDPVDLTGALSAGAVERSWGADRFALATCRDRHSAVLDFYSHRDAALSGVRP